MRGNFRILLDALELLSWYSPTELLFLINVFRSSRVSIASVQKIIRCLPTSLSTVWTEKVTDKVWWEKQRRCTSVMSAEKRRKTKETWNRSFCKVLFLKCPFEFALFCFRPMMFLKSIKAVWAVRYLIQILLLLNKKIYMSYVTSSMILESLKCHQ